MILIWAEFGFGIEIGIHMGRGIPEVHGGDTWKIG